jgi:hypothetical protein
MTIHEPRSVISFWMPLRVSLTCSQSMTPFQSEIGHSEIRGDTRLNLSPFHDKWKRNKASLAIQASLRLAILSLALKKIHVIRIILFGIS